MATSSPVVIITGASSGIGEATARALAADGMRLVLAARRTERLEKLQAEIQAAGAQALTVATDVTRPSDMAQLAAKSLATFGQIDVLINNAGVMLLTLLKNLRLDDWERMIDVNLKGALYGIAAVLPHMRDRRQGHIINVSSVAGRLVFPTGAVYCATKMALNAVSEGLRQELSPKDNIRITTIEPGRVATELTTHIGDPEVIESRRSAADFPPLQAEDVAAAIRYALQQPAHVAINEVLIRPTQQVL